MNTPTNAAEQAYVLFLEWQAGTSTEPNIKTALERIIAASVADLSTKIGAMGIAIALMEKNLPKGLPSRCTLDLDSVTYWQREIEKDLKHFTTVQPQASHETPLGSPRRSAPALRLRPTGFQAVPA